MNAHRTLIISVFYRRQLRPRLRAHHRRARKLSFGRQYFAVFLRHRALSVSMGIGAHLTQYIKDKDVLHRFIEIELLVGIIGGISALALFVAFGLSAAPFRTLLYAFVLIVGAVVGMEIPLVMRVLNQKGAEFKELVPKY